MFNRRSNVFFAAALAILLSSGNIKGSDSPAVSPQIAETIAKVRTGGTSMDRTAAARQLYDLTRGRRNASRVDTATITEIVSLLDSSEDSVRYWVAGALGNIGRRAQIAVPKLQKLLSEVDCLAVDKSSSEAIRYALKRMGAKLPPECRDYHAPSHQ